MRSTTAHTTQRASFSVGSTLRILVVAIVATLTAGAVCAQATEGGGEGGARLSQDMFQTFEVSGTGTHFFSTAMVHDQKPTETGMIQRSTDLIQLEGDLNGMVLYHPRSVFDFAAGKLVNTGHQVFSGSIRGSRPVMLYDDSFRFEVDLQTGETIGRVFLIDQIAGPMTRCRLLISGIGEQTPEGDAVVDYTGTCRVNPRVDAHPNE